MTDIITPARFEYERGELRGVRIVPTRFAYTAGSFLTGSESPTSTAAEIPELDRLTFGDKIPGESEQSFMRRAAIWQKTMEAIESAFEAVNARVDEVAILARLSAVEAKAEAANDNANEAKTVANTANVAVEQTFSQIDPNLAEYYRSVNPDYVAP